MKKRFHIVILAFVLLAQSVVFAQETAFLSALNDVPLMEGLNEAVQDTVNFNTPSGRIVDAYAVGDVPVQRIKSYYQESLSSLGWQETSSMTFMRDDEILQITFEDDAGNTTVRFSLSPEK